MIKENNRVTAKVYCHPCTFLSVLFSAEKVMNLRSTEKEKDKKAKRLVALYDIV